MSMKVDTSKLKFVIYARKSTESAERQIASLGDQLTIAREIAKRNKYKVVKVFSESGSARKADNRPEYNKMLEMIKSGEANGIICWHTNRLSRNPAESGILQYLLVNHIIECIHTHDKIYYPEDNMLIYSIEAGMNAEYSKKLSEDVKRGVHMKNKRGGYNTVAPQGYLNSHTEDGRAIIIEDPKRFPLIKKMFDLYLTGTYSIPELADIINNEWGYLTKKHKKRGGVPLSTTTINGILSNPFYMGKIRDMEDKAILHQGAWKPMITEDEYWRIQELKGAYAVKHNLRPQCRACGNRYDLKGLIVCGCCGCSIIGEKHIRKTLDGGANEHIYYKCTKKSPHRKCTMRGSITEEEATRQIYDLLDSYRIHPTLHEWSKKIMESIHKKEIEERYNISEMHNTALEKCQNKLSKLLDMRLNLDDYDEEDDEMYRQKEKELKDQIRRIKEAHREVKELNRNWYEIIGKTLEILQSPTEKFDAALDVGEKRAILQAIGPKAVLTEREVLRGGNLRAITRKIIEVEPYPWLEKIVKSSKKLAPELAKGQNAILQGQNNQKQALYSVWSGRLDSNQRPHGPKPCALPTVLRPVVCIILQFP